MTDISTQSGCVPKGEAYLTCPHCGSDGIKKVFGCSTGLYFKSIQLKELHNNFFAVCPDCRQAFGVGE